MMQGVTTKYDGMWEILSGVSASHRRGRGHAGPPAATVAESERLCGAVGAIGKGRGSIAGDPVWGSLPLACPPRVHGALSSRAESSGQGQCPALSSVKARRKACRPDALSRTARRAPEILRVRSRMSFLTH